MPRSTPIFLAAKAFLMLGMVTAFTLVACARTRSVAGTPGSSPDFPAESTPREGIVPVPEAPYVGTWVGKQMGTENTQAIITFKPEGVTYTLLKRGVDYTALSSPFQYRVNANHDLFDIDLQNSQTSEADNRWGIMHLVNHEQLLLTTVQTSLPRPEAFESNLTLDLKRRVEPPFSISPSIAQLSQFFLEYLVEQQLANYIEQGQFSDLNLAELDLMATRHYQYEITRQSRDLIKIDATPREDYLPSFTAVVMINGSRLTPSQLTATLCRSNTEQSTPPGMPTLSQGQWQCAAGSTKPELPALDMF
jgi:Type IV pilin-like G and H, putative